MVRGPGTDHLHPEGRRIRWSHGGQVWTVSRPMQKPGVNATPLRIGLCDPFVTVPAIIVGRCGKVPSPAPLLPIRDIRLGFQRATADLLNTKNVVIRNQPRAQNRR
jgi:hypothetical protein